MIFILSIKKEQVILCEEEEKTNVNLDFKGALYLYFLVLISNADPDIKNIVSL